MSLGIGKSQASTAAPTIVAAAYGANDLVGDKLSFTGALASGNRNGALLRSITVADKAVQDAELDIVLFDSDPDSTTFTDNAALTVDDADLLKILGVVNIPAANYADFAANSVATVNNINLILRLASSTDGGTIYGAVITRGTPTYASASDLQITLGLERD